MVVRLIKNRAKKNHANSINVSHNIKTRKHIIYYIKLRI